MAKEGLERREVAKDNLAGQADIKPIFLRGVGISAPRMAAIPQTQAGQLAAALGQFASEKLTNDINVRNERMKADGAILSVQGVAYDQVELNGGDKFAQQGHAVMNAATTSSALVAAQLQHLEQGGAAQSQDEFRQSYVDRMTDATAGQPPEVATAIRDQMVKQMPALVEKHTVAHMKHLEKQNYDALAGSIDIVSQDPTGEDTVLNFMTGGEDSASAFLSPERKQSAIARGVQIAFRNDNPLAYSIMQRNGLMESLTLEQQNAVENSKAQFQNRMRSQANEDLVTRIQDIEDRVEAGELKGHAMLEEYATTMAEYDIEITFQEQQVMVQKAGEADNVKGKTQSLILERNLLAGDYNAAGEIMADVMEWTETRGREVDGPLITSGANKGTHAQGITQVMPLTSGDPGFGVRKAANNTPAELRRVGRDYWKALYLGNKNPSGNLPWEAGDWEATAVAYNAGHVNAKKWIKAGRDYSVLPNTKQTLEYTTRMAKRMGNMQAPTVGDKYNRAVELLAAAKATDIVKSTDVYNQLSVPVTAAFRQDGNVSAFRAGMEAARNAAGLAMSQQTVATEFARQERISAQIVTAADKDQAEASKLAYKARMVDPTIKWQTVMENPQSTPQQRKAATTAFVTSSNEAMAEAGVQEIDTANTKLVETVQAALEKVIPIERKRQEHLELQRDAIRRGSFEGLSKADKQEAIRNESKQLDKTLEENFQSTGGGEQQWQAMAEDAKYKYAELYVRYNEVPDDVRASMSAAIMRGLVDKDNKPLREAVSAIEHYMVMKEVDPHGDVAESYLDANARAVAEAVLYAAGPEANVIGVKEAMVHVATNMNPQTPAQLDAIANALDVETRVEDAVDSRTETDIVGIFQAIFSSDADLADFDNFAPSEIASLRSPIMQDKQREAVKAEVRRLAYLHPRNRPEWMVDMATANVNRRSANIGGDWVQMKTDIKRQLFGDKVNHYDQAGIVNKAVMEYMASPEMLQAHKVFGGVGFTELFAPILQEGISLLPGVDWTQGLSMSDAKIAVARGVRPFRSYVSADGTKLLVSVIRRDGNESQPVHIDLAAAGEYYKTQHSPVAKALRQDAMEATGFVPTGVFQ